MSGVQMMLAASTSQPGVAAFTNFSDGDVGEGGGGADMTYTIGNNGLVTFDASNSGGGTYEQWLTPIVGADQYEVYATLNSGALSTGTTGVWLNLGTSQSWSVAQVGAGGSSADMTMEVRRVGTGSVLDTWTVSISATVTP